MLHCVSEFCFTLKRIEICFSSNEVTWRSALSFWSFFLLPFPPFIHSYESFWVAITLELVFPFSFFLLFLLFFATIDSSYFWNSYQFPIGAPVFNKVSELWVEIKLNISWPNVSPRNCLSFSSPVVFCPASWIFTMHIYSLGFSNRFKRISDWALFVHSSQLSSTQPH